MSGVGKERSSAETSVELAFCVAPERVKTYRRIETAGRKTEECGLSFGRVATRIAPVRRWDNSLRYRQRPKTSEQQRYEQNRISLCKLNEWIHGSTFLSPLSYISEWRVRKRRRTERGRLASSLIQIRLATRV